MSIYYSNFVVIFFYINTILLNSKFYTMNTPQLETQQEVFAELENELHIEELEERLEMTTNVSEREPPKLPM